MVIVDDCEDGSLWNEGTMYHSNWIPADHDSLRPISAFISYPKYHGLAVDANEYGMQTISLKGYRGEEDKELDLFLKQLGKIRDKFYSTLKRLEHCFVQKQAPSEVGVSTHDLSATKLLKKIAFYPALARPASPSPPASPSRLSHNSPCGN